MLDILRRSMFASQTNKHVYLILSTSYAWCCVLACSLIMQWT